MVTGLRSSLTIWVAALVALAWVSTLTGEAASGFGFQALGRLGDGEFHALTFPSLEGVPIPFDKFKGKVVLLTNVASECGYTENNYEQLLQLKSKFGDDLEIVLIPSNDFGEQEPGSEKDIRSFINERGGAEYTILKKSHVNGPEQHPLMKLLKQSTKTLDKDITWNFETKFFVSPDGKTVSRYSDAFEPIKLIESIKYFVRTRPTEL